MVIRSYQDLIVWQKAMELVLEIYRLTRLFPKEERFGLVSQMRRAVIAIPSNIAEGYMRRHRREYIQFISIAYGSAGELDTQLIAAKRLHMAPEKEFTRSESLLQEVLAMLNSLSSKLSTIS